MTATADDTLKVNVRKVRQIAFAIERLAATIRDCHAEGDAGVVYDHIDLAKDLVPAADVSLINSSL